jgi:alkaline phosphatase D
MGNLPMTDYENSLFTIDPWSGFPYELNQITSAFNTNKATGIVSLSGDHHMHGAGKISIHQKDQPSKTVCLDFSVAGISSTPLFKTLASRVNDSHSTFKPLVFSEKSGSEQITWNMTMTEGVLASFFYDLTGLEMLSRWLGPNKANKGLKYVDSDSNGYGLATFSSQKIDIAFITMPPPSTSFNQIPDKKHVAHFSVPLWKNNENPELREPTFDGEPPFPFKKTNQVVRN